MSRAELLKGIAATIITVVLFSMVVLPIVENSNVASVETNTEKAMNMMDPVGFYKVYDADRGNIVITMAEGVEPITVKDIITDTFRMSYSSGELTYTDRYGTDTFTSSDLTKITIDLIDRVVIVEGPESEELEGLEFGMLLVNSSRSIAEYGAYSGNDISQSDALYVEDDLTVMEITSSKIYSGKIGSLINIGGGNDDTMNGIFDVTSAVGTITLIVPIEYEWDETRFILDEDSKTILGIIVLMVILAILVGVVRVYFLNRRF